MARTGSSKAAAGNEQNARLEVMVLQLRGSNYDRIT
jgi:hypothetical protein